MALATWRQAEQESVDAFKCMAEACTVHLAYPFESARSHRVQVSVERESLWQIFYHWRRAVEFYAQHLEFGLRLDSELFGLLRRI